MMNSLKRLMLVALVGSMFQVTSQPLFAMEHQVSGDQGSGDEGSGPRRRKRSATVVESGDRGDEGNVTEAVVKPAGKKASWLSTRNVVTAGVVAALAAGYVLLPAGTAEAMCSWDGTALLGDGNLLNWINSARDLVCQYLVPVPTEDVVAWFTDKVPGFFDALGDQAADLAGYIASCANIETLRTLAEQGVAPTAEQFAAACS